MDVLVAGVQVAAAVALVVLHVHQISVETEHRVPRALGPRAQSEASRQSLAGLPCHQVPACDAPGPGTLVSTVQVYSTVQDISHLSTGLENCLPREEGVEGPLEIPLSDNCFL